MTKAVGLPGLAVIAADKTIDHTGPTCRQGLRRTLLRRFGWTRGGLATAWWVLAFPESQDWQILAVLPLVL